MLNICSPVQRRVSLTRCGRRNSLAPMVSRLMRHRLARSTMNSRSSARRLVTRLAAQIAVGLLCSIATAQTPDVFTGSTAVDQGSSPLSDWTSYFISLLADNRLTRYLGSLIMQFCCFSRLISTTTLTLIVACGLGCGGPIIGIPIDSSPSADMSSSSVMFGSVTSGTSSSAQTVTLSNTGNGTLEISRSYR